jgi:hypothetical protein
VSEKFHRCGGGRKIGRGECAMFKELNEGLSYTILEQQGPDGTAIIVLPQVDWMDWSRVKADPSIPVFISNKPSEAALSCRFGQFAIAVFGVSKAVVKQWLRDQGVNVKD